MEFMRVPDPRNPAGIPSPDLASPDFELRVERALSLLSMTNLRLSVFAVRVRGCDGPALSKLLRTALGRSHEVACVDGHTAGILYYGPRPGGPGADRRVEEDLFVRLDMALRDFGQDSASLQALHVSSAHVVDAGDLIRNLRGTPVLSPSPTPSVRPLAA